jgi:dTDP-4-dehydrorhamnose 3,5-epimerase
VELVLYDGRKGLKTGREVNEFVIGEQNYSLVKVPPEAWHEFKVISQKPALVLNTTAELYDYKAPNEDRLPPGTDKIPYDRKLAPWLKHT